MELKTKWRGRRYARQGVAVEEGCINSKAWSFDDIAVMYYPVGDLSYGNTSEGIFSLNPREQLMFTFEAIHAGEFQVFKKDNNIGIYFTLLFSCRILGLGRNVFAFG